MHNTPTLAISDQINETGLSLGIIVAESSVRGRLLEALDAADIECRAQAATGDELATLAPELDVAVLYASASGNNGGGLVDAVRSARGALPPTASLVAVWPPCSASDSRRALRAGADGLVSEEDLVRTLGPTIHAVRSGVVCVPRPMRTQLESESLSMREKQVLGMLVMGFTNAEIATRMFLAESTVKSHLSSAYTKLGVRSRKDAAMMILDPVEGLGPGILTISAA